MKNDSASLPVLFADELTIEDDHVVSYTPMSGSYPSPSCQREVAQRHPLLEQAQLHAPEGCNA